MQGVIFTSVNTTDRWFVSTTGSLYHELRDAAGRPFWDFVNLKQEGRVDAFMKLLGKDRVKVSEVIN